MVRLARSFAAALLSTVALALPASAAAAETPALRVRLAAGELRVGVSDGADGARLELRLARPDGSIALLPEPAPRSAARLDEPTPLVAAGTLAGLAWLEGATRESYGVRYAPWTGAGWGAVETVAAPGPGSQLALAALVLADGRRLLTWAGYDGHDDEILYALRAPDGRWSAPARVAGDNEVPDITPAVAAAPGPDGGALVAWSRYHDGQYRVAVARFDGERFRSAKLVGRPGTLYPGFLPPGADGAPRLLFRNARPAGWTVAELDRSGAIFRESFVEASGPERPTGVRTRDGRLQLLFGDAGAQR